jgi:hypothetical protein
MAEENNPGIPDGYGPPYTDEERQAWQTMSCWYSSVAAMVVPVCEAILEKYDDLTAFELGVVLGKEQRRFPSVTEDDVFAALDGVRCLAEAIGDQPGFEECWYPAETGITRKPTIVDAARFMLRANYARP